MSNKKSVITRYSIRCKSTLNLQSLLHGYGYCSYASPTAFDYLL